MKSLHDYIAERNSNYTFRVKIAKQNPKEIMDEIKNALDAYELTEITSLKSLPVQEHREFPRWGACECWQFEATVAYPTTSAQITQLLKERTGMNASWVCVQNKRQADDNDAFEAHGKDHDGSLLLNGELEDVPGAQDLVGEKRTDSLLKELDRASSKLIGFNEPDLTSTRASERTKAAQTTNALPQGNTSPVGTNKNKLPSIKGKK